MSVFVASLGLSMFMYFIPVFAQSFGATFLDLGVIGAVWALATAVTPLLAGHMADRMNRAWVFSVSLIINAFATFILIFSRSVFEIIVLRLIGGIGLGAFWPTAEVLVADIAPPERRVREMGHYSIALAAGTLVGPLIGGLIIESLGYVSLFIISSFVISVSFVQAVIWVVPSYRRREAPGVDSYSGQMRTVRKLLPWYLMLLCYGVVWALMTSIFPGYANSVGISAALIGVLFSAFGVSRIFSYATAHRYLGFGEKKALLLVSMLIFTGIICLAVLPGVLMFLVGMLLIGGGVGVVFPITITLIARHFPEGRTGAAVGSFETAVNIGETVGPYLAGVLASMANIESSFLTMSVFGLLMAFFAVNGRSYEDTHGSWQPV